MNCRVLHVTSGLSLHDGGPAVALAGLAIAQKRAGLDVRVVATYRENQKPSLAEQILREGVAVTCIGPCSGRFARHPILATCVAEAVEAAHIVHIHALFEEVQYLAATFARQHGKPYLIRPCGMLDRWSLRRNWFVKRIYLAWRLSPMLETASAIHYTTSFERRHAAHLRLRRTALIEPNGVDLAEYHNLPPAGLFRNRFRIPADTPLVTFLGRVHPGKGVEHLIPAFASSLLAKATLAVVGPDSGGYLESMRSLAARCGVADRVVFTGLLRGQDRISALVDADVFAMPSDHENFGIAVAEAMAAGKPVIVSPEVGIADDVTAAGAGAVVPLQPNLLAMELTRWLSDACLRANAGARGRAYAFERYGWHEIGRRWAGHYAAILGRSIAA